MRSIVLSVFFLLFSGHFGFAQQNPSIIPQPAELSLKGGVFKIDANTVIQFNTADSKLKATADYLNSQVNRLSGNTLSYNKPASKNIYFNLIQLPQGGAEGYVLDVQKESIRIKASDPAGIFYGIQSLLQTLPQVRTNAPLTVPCMEVKDQPRFKWRGMHLDVSRHFFSVDVVKQYIDLMAMYKMNTFHWHLVDDPGWRMEIKKYPKLTSVGAWRVNQNDKVWGARPQAQPGQQADYGGYYTQAQLKEVVAYAKARNITIVPEIEMPGHVASAIAAYPNLSCTQQPQLPMTGGNYSGVSSNYCASSEEVYTFLQDVLTEVLAIFPSTYIHIGGDEVDKTAWKKCARCQAKMKLEGLKNEEELQSYFIKRMEQFLLSKKRKMIGWDEILEGGLAPEATVMSWRGEAGGIEAAKMDHDVVMTPGTPCYFDHYQAGPEGEPTAIGGFNTLKRVYDYEPIPRELPADKHRFVLGAQANVWTEYITTPSHLEYMVLPRMLALAEAVWSPAAKKNWLDFNNRLQYHFTGFEQKGYTFSKGNFTVDILPTSPNGKLLVELKAENPAVAIHYTTDGTLPGLSSKRYTAPIAIEQSQVVKAISVLDGKVMVQTPAEQSFMMHKGLGAQVNYAKPVSTYYMAGGNNTLTDGIRGKAATGKFWHGFVNNDLEATIDLGQVKRISNIKLGCMQQYSAWIFLPKSVTIEVSEDGKQFRQVASLVTDIPPTQTAFMVKDYAAEFAAAPVRYIRIHATRLDACPPGHPGEGKPAWLFADELVVE